MDRRQRKTRESIFKGFMELLSEKKFSQITVSEIIERADVGRATFYAHFETKDFLLKELCSELFCHIFDSESKEKNNHKHIFECNAPDSVFLHLLEHLKKNDNHILELLSSQNNDLFSIYFKNGLKKLIENQLHLFENNSLSKLPKDFMINHIASTFIETVKWWSKNDMLYSPDVINRYFLTALNIFET